MKVTTNKIISIIAHDLKDPLTSITGISDILMNNWDDFTAEEKLDILQDIRDTSDTTLRLLSDLLDWSKKVNDISEPENRIFDAGKEVVAILESGIRKAKWKNTEIDNQVPSGIKLKADVNMFAAVFRNLLANAIKSCTRGGRIVISADCTGNFCKFCIADNGVGMTKNQIDALFAQKSSGDLKSLPSNYGNGFGLILCKDFVEIQGGELWAESEEGKGTRVYFTFPGAF